MSAGGIEASAEDFAGVAWNMSIYRQSSSYASLTTKLHHLRLKTSMGVCLRNHYRSAIPSLVCMFSTR